MKKLALGLLLVGCGQPHVEVSPTSTPSSLAVVATPISTPTPAKQDDITVLTGNHSDLGLTIQSRIDLLMAHLIASGKKRMTASWDVFPQGDGTYEVSYIISTIPKTVAARASATPIDNRAPREGGKARLDPFSQPPRAKRPDDAIVLTWIVNPAANAYLAKDVQTRALLSLPPQLDPKALEGVLPEKWQSSAPPPARATPPETKTATPPPEVNSPIPSPPAPTERMPSVEPDRRSKTPPFKFEGFIGSGIERKAIFSRGGEHVSLGVGGSISGFKVKSMADDEILLKRGSDVTRLIPGQTWDPGS